MRAIAILLPQGSTMRMIALLLLTTLSLPAAEQPGDTDKLAADLVKQLGHPKYAVRETASKRLLNMGGAALSALRIGLASPDEEVRSRCETLLPKAQAAEWARRADAYLAATDAMRPRDLPLIAEYVAMIGKDKMDAGARELFAEMVRTNGNLLEKVAADRPHSNTTCLARSKVVLDHARNGETQNKVTAGDLAALLFVQTLEPKAKLDDADRSSPGYLLVNPETSRCIRDKVIGTPFRSLLVHWSESRPEDDRQARGQFVRAIQTSPFPKAAPILIRAAEDEKANDMLIRFPAILALGRIETPESFSALTALVVYEKPLANVPFDRSFISDAAVAASLTLHGKKLADFGLTNEVTYTIQNFEERYELTLQAFPDETAREKGVKKWKAEVVDKK